MELIKINSNNRPYYSDDFIKGFECGAKRQFETDKKARPKGEWIVYEGGWKDLDYYPPKCKCNQCGYEEELYILNAKPTNFCPNCGADMTEREGE